VIRPELLHSGLLHHLAKLVLRSDSDRPQDELSLVVEDEALVPAWHGEDGCKRVIRIDEEWNGERLAFQRISKEFPALFPFVPISVRHFWRLRLESGAEKE
jgi:hypothetical protein